MDPFSFDWEASREQIGDAATAILNDPSILYLRRVTTVLKEQSKFRV